MVYVPLGSYRPDQPAYSNSSSSVCNNVIPLTKVELARDRNHPGRMFDLSFEPIRELSPYSSALTARNQGAYSLIDSTGNTLIFAGDISKLYKLDATSTTFADVSKSLTTYATPTDGFWNANLFGDRVIMTNFIDPIQQFQIGTSTLFTDLAAAAPKARYSAIVRDFYVVANTNDATDGDQPQRVWWSAIDDPTDWPTPGTVAAAQVQSDYQNLPGDDGWIQGIVSGLGTADAVIFKERSVTRMTYRGPPTIFDFDVAEGIRGTPAPRSIVQYGSSVFYLGDDGFYQFDGSQSIPIGSQKVDDTFFKEVADDLFHLIIGAIDPINKIVFWAYPDSSNTGLPNKILAYNWSIDEWSVIEQEVENLVRSTTFGLNLEQLDDISTSLDLLPASLDSRIYTGGRTVLAGFDSDHKLGYFGGANKATTVETRQIQPYPDRRATVITTRPIIENGNPSVQVTTRNRLVDTPVTDTAVAMNDIGECPQHINGRYIRCQTTTPAGDSAEKIQGVEVITRMGGRQ